MSNILQWENMFPQMHAEVKQNYYFLLVQLEDFPIIIKHFSKYF